MGFFRRDKVRAMIIRINRKRGLHQTMAIHLLFIPTILFVSGIYNFSHQNQFVVAFFVRESRATKALLHDPRRRNTCWLGGNGEHNSRTGIIIFAGEPILFNEVNTDLEKERNTNQRQIQTESLLPVGNIIPSTQSSTTTTPETVFLDSRIDVVLPKNEDTTLTKDLLVTSPLTTTTAIYAADNNIKLSAGQSESFSEEAGDEDNDVAKPTVNGGFSHTKSSRAKISAANKGKTPWNKGKPRSKEVKARIAAGVRAKNRERFLKKLEDMGVTEEAYEAKRKETRRINEAERRARRTANGGYSPTDETKKKISRVLKEKYAKGEVKPRSKIDPSKVRKGFTHSKETRKKISESLRKRWRSDPTFKLNMNNSVTSRKDVRERISQTLKKRWQDPEFRATMMDKISTRKSIKNSRGYDENHRKKISDAIKLKWQDASYRDKTLSSIQKSAKNRKKPTIPKNKLKAQATKTVRKSKVKKVKMELQIGETMQPLMPTDTTKRKIKKKALLEIATDMKIIDEDKLSLKLVAPVKSVKSNPKKTKGLEKLTSASRISLKNNGENPKERKKKKPKEKDGSVNRLREERRDLFDLLYGDEDDVKKDTDGDEDYMLSQSSSRLGDEDLDTFDPYGLDDY